MIPPTATPRHIALAIRFLTRRDGRIVERGRETAHYDFHADGLISFTVRSHSAAPQTLREAIYTLGPDYRPREAFVRLQVDGAHEGSGWFRFEPTRIECETWNRSAGRASSATPVALPARAFVAHPVTTDVMLVAAYRRGGPGRQTLEGVYTSSADPYGRVGPTLEPSSVELEHVGQERISTPAGPVQADRYELYTSPGSTQPLETLWTLPDTAVFVRAQARGRYDTVYELTEFTVER